jgi:PAS domain S-box-containing protein
MNSGKEIELLNRKIQREKAARLTAEEILEGKALELFFVNQNLLELNRTLEREVVNRTNDLVNSNLRYEQLVESANDIIYEVDSEGNFLYANQVTQRILQRSMEELIGMFIIDLIADSHKKIILDAFIESHEKKEDKIYSEFPCQRPNGEIIWISQNFQNDFEIVNGENVFKGGKGVARDITERYLGRKQLELSEVKYRNIIENMDLGYLEVDLSGRILRAYDKFLQMTGYTKEDLIGNIADDILLPDDFKELMKQQDESRRLGEVSTYELQIKKKNGELLWVLISGGPVIDEKGNTIGSVGIHYDLTIQKKVQQELMEAKKVAEQAQEVEQEFLANMSHEIRTPLNAIIGMSHLLYDTEPSAQQLEYFNVIENSANFLHTLISDVLDMAKMEAGKIEVKQDPFDLLSLLNIIQRTFELKTGVKNLKVICKTDSKIQNLIVGDETLLNQILYNLVGNAEKFTETGSITIKAETVSDEKAKYILKISVIDTGIGIPDNKIGDVFDKFKQIHSVDNERRKGNGLGLAIVKGLVERMGGEVSVRSVYGEGSNFSFVLPFGKTDLVAKDQMITAHDPKQSFGGKNVLLVEDNAMNRLYATKILEKWGLCLKQAGDGLEAIEMVKKYHFDLILMDVQMPHLDGYEATIQIRNTINLNKNTPIIALTASALDSRRKKAVEVGMNGMLSKPFTPKELKDIINQYLDVEKNTLPEPVLDQRSAELVLDQNRLLEIYGRDSDFKKMVFETFIEEIPSQIQDMKGFLEIEHWSELANVAHKMKPSLGMVGLLKVEEELGMIETTIKSDGINDEIIGMAQKLVNNFNDYIDIVKTELDKIA